MVDKISTLSWTEFSQYLLAEKDVKPTSSNKACFTYLLHYFQQNGITRESFRALIYSFLTEKAEKKLTKATINKYIDVGKRMAEYLGYDCLKEFKRLKVADHKPLGDLLSDREMRMIAECHLQRSRQEGEINLRYDTAIQLMRFSGMPPDDLCSLKWEHDQLTHFRLKRGKTGKERVVPIPQIVRKLLDKLTRYPNNYVFGTAYGPMIPNTIRRELKLRAQRLKIKKRVTCYSFRYSFDTLCLDGAGDGVAMKIAPIAGHSLEVARKHYVRFNSQSFIDALESTHPGLAKKADIDTIKRVTMECLTRMFDMSQYEVDIQITKKIKSSRKIHLS